MRPPRPSSSSSSYSLAATSLNSRLLTVFKKAQELTTLCDIEACVIHYGPDGELKTWPEDRDKVRSLALRYIQLDKAKRRKKRVNLHEFLNKNKDKKTMLNKFKKRNVEELKYPISDHYSPDQGHVRFFIQLNHLAEAERVVRLDTKNITHSNGSVE